MTDGSASVGSLLKAAISRMGAAQASCLAALVVAVALTVSTNVLPLALRPLVVLVAIVIAQGALYRHAFGRSRGINGLRWGRDEWRLLGAHLMGLGLFLLIGSILLIVIGAITLGVARASAPQLDVGSAQAWREALANAGPAGFVAGLAPLAALAILIWLALRLSFTAPATIAESGIRVLSAFPLTKGQVPILLLPGIFALPMAANLLYALAPPRGVVSTAGAAILAYVVMAPIWSVMMAYLYRQSAVSQDA